MDEVTLASLIRKSLPNDGIGLLMGSRLPDGTRLGAVDVDDDRYTRLVSFLLGNPRVGRIGSKGADFFVRVKGEPVGRDSANPEFKVVGRPELGKVVECLLSKKLCVIPPTIHPDTGKPYRWIGPSLLDVPFSDLPVVDLGADAGNHTRSRTHK